MLNEDVSNDEVSTLQNLVYVTIITQLVSLDLLFLLLQVYSETVEPVVPLIFHRTKATCFAYGQTGKWFGSSEWTKVYVDHMRGLLFDNYKHD